jgi:hypothetical protein
MNSNARYQRSTRNRRVRGIKRQRNRRNNRVNNTRTVPRNAPRRLRNIVTQQRNQQNNINNNNNNNNNNGDILKLNERIDSLTNKMDKLSLEIFPKITNVNRKKKEPRSDKILTPMNMALSSRIISLYPTNNRVVPFTVYSRIQINTLNYDHNIIWFPYFTNFTEYRHLPITYQVSANVPVDTATNIYGMHKNPNNKYDFNLYQSTPCGLYGNYRVIGATMKITNTTPLMNKGGTYYVYKMNDNLIFPLFYNKQGGVDWSWDNDTAHKVEALINSAKTQIQVKQNFASSDVGYIHEFNTYEGNNIFQTPLEYLGNDFVGPQPGNFLYWTNAVGNNIKYWITIPSMGNVTNTYVLETWQVLEIVPDPELQLDMLAGTQKYVYQPEQIKEINDFFPITKQPNFD